ncbi:MAG: Do family serine endopeptidase [Myxococcales bacterium]|nr:Do family serine endopeptidase [Myxococcales bacterium]
MFATSPIHASTPRRRRRARGLSILAAPALALALGACASAPQGLPANDARPAAEPSGALAASAPAPTVALPLAKPVEVGTPANVADLVEAVAPSVVNIMTTTKLTGLDGASPFDFFFQHPPLGPEGAPGRPERQGAGTGFIVDAAGYVVTNAHVVEDADQVKVRLADDRVLDADVVGRDRKVDLALLKLRAAENLPAVALGTAEKLRVGESVLAVGNPFGLGQTVTLGIVSAKARTIGAGPYDDFIQTDASINPGNSGGPLFNLRGEVVGINTAIRAGANGIGFAIPVETLKDVMTQLKTRGYVERGKLGLAFQPLTDDLAHALGLERPHGAVVNEVLTGSAAAKAGIREGDVIVSVEGEPIKRAEDLPRNVARHAPGSQIRLELLRQGKPLAVTATLDRLDEPVESGDRGPAPPAPASTDTLLGLELAEGPGGVRVVKVTGAAREIQPGDVIVEVAGTAVKTTAELRAATAKLGKGGTALFKVKRGVRTLYVGVPVPG